VTRNDELAENIESFGFKLFAVAGGMLAEAPCPLSQLPFARGGK
jgi:hypothetical protein